MITAIIPVKSHSERLPNKNAVDYRGMSLYEHKFKQLRNVPFDEILVSSESKDVLQVARKYGFETHNRDPHYSTSEIPMSEVYKTLASVASGGDIAWVNVTNPLVSTKYYTEAILLYNSSKEYYDSFLSVNKIQKYLFYNGVPINFVPYPHPRSQDLDGMYAMNFAINIRPREDLIKYGTYVGKRPFFYLLDRYLATKIDYEEDLVTCEALQKLYKERNDG